MYVSRRGWFPDRKHFMSVWQPSLGTGDVRFVLYGFVTPDKYSTGNLDGAV